MSFIEQVDTLKAKHHALEDEIDTEKNRPHPDDLMIADLKKQKLKIKDQLEEITH
ncbi:MAG: YdcH family protein [Rhodospirillales bacterium]|jgi:hypothetical protein|nr:YdcH family protein [Rhodospirillales bacterium]